MVVRGGSFVASVAAEPVMATTFVALIMLLRLP